MGLFYLFDPILDGFLLGVVLFLFRYIFLRLLPALGEKLHCGFVGTVAAFKGEFRFPG